MCLPTIFKGMGILLSCIKTNHVYLRKEKKAVVILFYSAKTTINILVCIFLDSSFKFINIFSSGKMQPARQM